MTKYVAGFLIDQRKQNVALIRKARPAWQAGRLNGIGGHIEPGETAQAAMRREFHEETGAGTPLWQPFATVLGDWGTVEFFRLFEDAPFGVLRSTTDEPVEVHRIDQMPWDECLPNLSWLIPLALYTHDRYAPLRASEMTS